MPSENGALNGETKTNKDSIVGIANVDENDTSSYMANYKAHKPGISHEEMIMAYTDWANNYDADLCPGRYNGPEIAGNALAKVYTNPSERASIVILDVAAGTGRVGYELFQREFRRIDALEPSEGMLQVLKGRNIYHKTFQTPIGSKSSSNLIPAKTYDSLVVAGGMGEGHIPVDAIDEMIRLVKSGGTIVIVMREEYLTYVVDYVDKLEPYMHQLEKKGYWKQVSREIVPDYSFNKNGVVYTYEVTSEDFPE